MMRRFAMSLHGEGSGSGWLETTKMPSTSKRAIRELMAKTGMSYQAAKRAHSGEPSRFRATITHLIEVARLRRDEEREARARRFRETGSYSVNIGSVSIEDLIGPPKGAEKMLIDALEALSDDDLRKVEVIMYAGRDGGGVMNTHRSLLRDDRFAMIDIISEKLPLDDYLTRGLGEVDREHVDLDVAW
jgi:hypothetical protein